MYIFTFSPVALLTKYLNVLKCFLILLPYASFTGMAFFWCAWRLTRVFAFAIRFWFAIRITFCFYSFFFERDFRTFFFGPALDKRFFDVWGSRLFDRGGASPIELLSAF